jgi:hypothetical protein
MSGITYDSGHPSRDPDNSLTQNHFIDSVNPVYAPSVVHRNVLGSQLPGWFFQLPFLDLGFYFLLLQHGRIKYLPDVMCVYRIHQAGAYQGNSEYNNLKKFVLFFRTLQQHIPHLNVRRLRLVICRFSLRLLNANLKKNNMEEARKNIVTLREHRFEGIIQHERLLFRTIILLLLKLPLMVFSQSRSKNKDLKQAASGLFLFCLERGSW